MDPERYYKLSIRASVAALCQSFGWHGILGGTCDTLSDIGVRYLIDIGRNISSYAAHGKCEYQNNYIKLCSFFNI